MNLPPKIFPVWASPRPIVTSNHFQKAIRWWAWITPGSHPATNGRMDRTRSILPAEPVINYLPLKIPPKIPLRPKHPKGLRYRASKSCSTGYARSAAERSELLEGKSQPGIDCTPECRIPIHFLIIFIHQIFYSSKQFDPLGNLIVSK